MDEAVVNRKRQRGDGDNIDANTTTNVNQHDNPGSVAEVVTSTGEAAATLPRQPAAEAAKLRRHRPRTVYLREHSTGLYDFSAMVAQHPMKPLRVELAHTLVDLYGLAAHMTVVRPPPVTYQQLVDDYHSEEYISNLALFNHHTWVWGSVQSAFRFTSDCPPVEGILNYGAAIAGASVAGAVLLNKGLTDIAINWAGGMHHAKHGGCSGFCYVNDAVLAIIELLKCHQRVLYIDIDIHHGDGVEEAFYTTDSVFTLSLHKFGDDFFPGTGHPADIGADTGRHYSLNVPLADGITDAQYTALFDSLVEEICHRYRPDAVVLQCGADSVSGDRVGTFNVSSVGHGHCITTVKHLRLPLLVLGGGGYTVTNVARIWAYETSLLCSTYDVDAPNGNGGDAEEVEEEAVVPPLSPYTSIPQHKYSQLYPDKARLVVGSSLARPNVNSSVGLQRVRKQALTSLRHTTAIEGSKP